MEGSAGCLTVEN